MDQHPFDLVASALRARQFALVHDPVQEPWASMARGLRSQGRIVDGAIPLCLGPAPNTETVDASGLPTCITIADRDESNPHAVGGWWSITDSEPVSLIPGFRAPTMGPVAVLAPDTSILNAIIDGLHTHETGVCFAGIYDPNMATAALLLDHAARQEHTAVIVLAIPDEMLTSELAAVARAVAPHLPIVALRWSTQSVEAVNHATVSAWSETFGIIQCAELDEAATISATIAQPLPPLDGVQVQILGHGRALDDMVAHMLRVRGAMAASFVCSVDMDAFEDAFHAHIADQSPDVILAIPDTSALTEPDLRSFAASLHHIISQSPHRPVMVVAQEPVLRADLRRLGVPTARGVGAAVAAIAALHAWGENLRLIPGKNPPEVQDAARFRRAINALARNPVDIYASSIQGEFNASLGMPNPKSVTIRYPEDAVIAASQLSYPVHLSCGAWRDLWRGPPSAVAHNAQEVAARATDLLAAARGAVGDDAAVVVRALPDGVSFHAEATRDPQFGVVITLAALGESDVVVYPVSAGRIAHLVKRALGVAPFADAAVDALYDTAVRLVAAISVDDAIVSVRIDPLIITPNGARPVSTIVVLRGPDD